MKKYTIELIETDKMISIKRTAENLTAIEVLGLLSHAQMEILQQMQGIIRPTITTREVIQDIPTIK